MTQLVFWARILVIVLSAFMTGHYIDKVLPPRDENLLIVIFLMLFGWIICTVYSRLLAYKVSFEKYQTGIAIAVAIPVFISLLGDRTEFAKALTQCLFYFMLYINGTLDLFGRSFNLLKMQK